MKAESNAGLHPAPPAVLWPANLIAALSFFLGFPSGLVLAAINWHRMNHRRKAVAHLIGGILGTVAFLLLLILSPPRAGWQIVIVVNVGIAYSLLQQMQSDVEQCRATRRVANATWWSAGLIGLGVLIVFSALVFVLAMIFRLMGVKFS